MKKSELSAREKVRASFGFLVVGGFFAFVFVMVFVPPQSDIQSSLLTGIVGILSALIVAIAQYYYGSSEGSTKKSETIDRISNNTDPPKE